MEAVLIGSPNLYWLPCNNSLLTEAPFNFYFKSCCINKIDKLNYGFYFTRSTSNHNFTSVALYDSGVDVFSFNKSGKLEIKFFYTQMYTLSLNEVCVFCTSWFSRRERLSVNANL